jgi:hypothetical protein
MLGREGAGLFGGEDVEGGVLDDELSRHGGGDGAGRVDGVVAHGVGRRRLDPHQHPQPAGPRRGGPREVQPADGVDGAAGRVDVAREELRGRAGGWGAGRGWRRALRGLRGQVVEEGCNRYGRTRFGLSGRELRCLKLMGCMLIVGAVYMEDALQLWAEAGTDLLDLAIFANLFFTYLVPVIRMENPFNVPMH